MNGLIGVFAGDVTDGRNFNGSLGRRTAV